MQAQPDIFKLPYDRFEKVMKFSYIASIQDLSTAASILQSFSWDLQMALGSIDFNQFVKEERKVQKQSKIKGDEKEQQKPVHIEQNNRSLIADSQLKPILFNSYLESLYKYKWNLSPLNFNKSLQTSRRQIKFLLVYVHPTDKKKQEQYKANFEKIANDTHIAQFIENHCITIGISGGSEDYELIKHHVEKEKGCEQPPLFMLFQKKCNHKGTIFLAFYRMDFEDQYLFLEWLAIYTGIYVNFSKIKEESKIHKQKRVEQNKEIPKQSIKKSHLNQHALLDNKNNFQKKPEIPQDKKNIKQQKSSPKINKNHEKFNFFPKQKELIESDSDQYEDIIPYQQQQKDKKKDPNNKLDIDNKKEKENPKEYIPKSDLSIINHQNKQYQQLQNNYKKKRQISKIQKQQINIKEKDISTKKILFLTKIKKINEDDPKIELKLRLPNGKNQIRVFNKHQKVQQIFYVVECFYRQSFEDKNADFDILYDFKSISQRKQQIFDDVFEGYEQCNIIIKQMQ